MAHYAKVLNGRVSRVIVAEPEFFDNFVDTEPGEWIQTSYNTRGGKHYDPETQLEDDGVPLRKNYASVGGIYDKKRDAFYSKQPYPSWTLNEETCLWEPPYPEPTDGAIYYWDEETYQTDNTAGWVINPNYPMEDT